MVKHTLQTTNLNDIQTTRPLPPVHSPFAAPYITTKHCFLSFHFLPCFLTFIMISTIIVFSVRRVLLYIMTNPSEMGTRLLPTTAGRVSVTATRTDASTTLPSTNTRPRTRQGEGASAWIAATTRSVTIVSAVWRDSIGRREPACLWRTCASRVIVSSQGSRKGKTSTSVNRRR